ncbi:MAG: hypothetical protein ACOYYI_01255 [Chloroflexota bacterium]
MSKMVRLYQVAFFARPFNPKATKKSITKLDQCGKSTLVHTIRIAASNLYEAERIGWERIKTVALSGALGKWSLENISKCETHALSLDQVFS